MWNHYYAFKYTKNNSKCNQLTFISTLNESHTTFSNKKSLSSIMVYSKYHHSLCNEFAHLCVHSIIDTDSFFFSVTHRPLYIPASTLSIWHAKLIWSGCSSSNKLALTWLLCYNLYLFPFTSSYKPQTHAEAYAWFVWNRKEGTQILWEIVPNGSIIAMLIS